MAVVQPSKLALFWRRNTVSIVFPILSFGAIFADYTHNQKFKASQALALSNFKEELKE